MIFAKNAALVKCFHLNRRERLHIVPVQIDTELECAAVWRWLGCAFARARDPGRVLNRASITNFEVAPSIDVGEMCAKRVEAALPSTGISA